MPYTAATITTSSFLLPANQTLDATQIRHQWPTRRVSVTRKPTNGDFMNSSPTKALLSVNPKKDMTTSTTAITSFRASSPPNMRRASYSSSPNRPSPLQLKDEIASINARNRRSLDFPSSTMVRKKSGEVVKSSIKSKSTPVTPTCPKFVHFDAQLEHVRLFLQAEVPESVLEDVEVDKIEDDTSDADSELSLALSNWSSGSMQSAIKTLCVDTIAFSADKTALNGTILVQNIAFHKCVTVRYTFDFWKSVDEVQAEYKDYLNKDNNMVGMDRFGFTISLVQKVGGDLSPRDEKKTMYFAVRYTVGGQDFWDNNDGMNYQVDFKRSSLSSPVVAKPVSAPARMFNSPMVKGSNLIDTLGTSPPAFMTDALGAVPPTKSADKKKLGNRYDFGASLSAVKKVAPAAVSPSRPAFMRTNTFPLYGDDTSESNTTEMALTERSPFSDIEPNIPARSFSTLAWDDIVGPQRDSPSLDNAYFGNIYPSMSTPPSRPISIPKPQSPMVWPSANSSGYFDLVNKYCFYGGNQSPYSNSPPAALPIQG